MLFLRCFSSVFSFQKFIVIHLGMNFFGLLTWALLFLNLWLYVSFLNYEDLSHFFFRCFSSPLALSFQDSPYTILLFYCSVRCTSGSLFKVLSMFSLLLDWTVSLPVFQLADPFLSPVHSAVEHALSPLFRPGGLRDFCGSVSDYHHEVNIAMK